MKSGFIFIISWKEWRPAKLSDPFTCMKSSSALFTDSDTSTKSLLLYCFLFFIFREKLSLFRLIISDVFTGLNWSYVFLIRISQNKCFFFLYNIQELQKVNVAVDNVNLDHFCTVVYARFIHCKVTVFAFFNGKHVGEDTLTLCKYRYRYPISFRSLHNNFSRQFCHQ